MECGHCVIAIYCFRSTEWAVVDNVRYEHPDHWLLSPGLSSPLSISRQSLLARANLCRAGSYPIKLAHIIPKLQCLNRLKLNWSDRFLTNEANITGAGQEERPPGSKSKSCCPCALRAPDPTLRAWHAQRAPPARADSTCDKTDPNEGIRLVTSHRASVIMYCTVQLSA